MCLQKCVDVKEGKVIFSVFHAILVSFSTTGRINNGSFMVEYLCSTTDLAA
jgi:hypothetical protein